MRSPQKKVAGRLPTGYVSPALAVSQGVPALAVYAAPALS